MLITNKSYTNKQWILNNYANNYSDNLTTLAEALNISEYTLKVLLNRKVDINDIQNYINPQVKNLMDDPYILDDMEKTCNIIYKHLSNSNNIVILGDYDVDGISSTAILCQYLQNIQPNIYTYIPHRYKEGYGITFKALENIYKFKPDLIILLDNGSVAYKEIEQAKNKGIDVIVIDHHSVELKPLNADAFINPQKPQCKSNLKHLCSVGLTFMLIVALNRFLRKTPLCENNSTKNVDITQYIPLVALGTICDMVELKGINRAFIKFGLKIINTNESNTLRYIINTMDMKEPITYETLGFLLGPCINAGSRMGNNTLPLRLLMSDFNIKSNHILIKDLIKLNESRKKEEANVVSHTISKIEDSSINNIIFHGSDTYNSGVLGIVAGRIKEIYYKPTCIFSLDKDTNIATSSGRSIDGIHLGNIILGALEKGIIIKGGGHSQAVGFSFDYNKIDDIKNYISKEVAKQSNLKSINVDQKIIVVDSIISLLNINIHLIENLQKISPFGIGFDEPIFLLNNIKLSDVKVIGKDKTHLSVSISDGTKYKIKGTCFKCLPGELGTALLNNHNNFVNLLVKLKLNYYLGRKSATFQVIDIAET